MAQDQEMFNIMERRDEDQILAELQGEVIEEYFYETKGKFVISYVGVKELARQYGNIDTKLVEMRETDEAWFIVIKAKDLEKGSGILGASTQKKLMKYKDELVPDEFCFQKAFSKAQRNAMKSLLPEAMFAKALEAWSKNKKAGSNQNNRRKTGSDVNITDYMKTVRIKIPDVPLSDELNRVEGNWDIGVTLTKEWMTEAGVNPEDFTITVDLKKLKVEAKKKMKPEFLMKFTALMAESGFKQTKPGRWRLNKKDVIG